MAKGQQRSNRETKKPKQDKPKAPPAGSPSTWVSVEKLKARDAQAAKKK